MRTKLNNIILVTKSFVMKTFCLLLGMLLYPFLFLHLAAQTTQTLHVQKTRTLKQPLKPQPVIPEATSENIAVPKQIDADGSNPIHRPTQDIAVPQTIVPATPIKDKKQPQ